MLRDDGFVWCLLQLCNESNMCAGFIAEIVFMEVAMDFMKISNPLCKNNMMAVL